MYIHRLAWSTQQPSSLTMITSSLLFYSLPYPHLSYQKVGNYYIYYYICLVTTTIVSALLFSIVVNMVRTHVDVYELYLSTYLPTHLSTYLPNIQFTA